ncbi:2-phosphosulfolactate phosphatase [Actinopolyspora xinjiangensis]|uniref:Probable 2-phosphosulfolactate phosphatase n=1 Tax=Actinopolyspora xinjiangensis TaxID=405564 RepID=A0A1H0U6Q6_9ACTN|nr:2-phosphosulfolactate phosphatase [Actinopolyspora xinjiangensis]SDP61839.1 2-phosphosulfolactate phosphatase [Actinopolyspora xinjiangensis]
MPHEQVMSPAAQSDHAVRFEWGLEGLRSLGEQCAVLVVVDVLSFATAVDVTTAAGAHVLPLPYRDDRAGDAASAAGAVLAGDRGSGGYSLSPASLANAPTGTLIGLPSPNGATLCSEAAGLGAVVFTGCLRNAAAVAAAAGSAAHNGPVGVIAAGERRADGSLRLAAEDLIGAGAIISALPVPVSARSVEAGMAARAYEASDDFAREVRECVSGRELTDQGYQRDVELALAWNASSTAPRLHAGVFSHR